METTGDKSLFCAGEFHPETSKVRAVHPADWSQIQEGARHPPRAAHNLLPADHRRQEEPFVCHVHSVGKHAFLLEISIQFLVF